MVHTKGIYLSGLLSLTLLGMACNESKHLGDGQNLYVANKIRIVSPVIKKHDAKETTAELADLLRPRLNGKVLGVRFRLLIYNIAGTPKKNKGFK